ncbi:hypothetical protein MMC10_009766 [Thelotrema lepadinum]|nr:hypothetical protein [Thelotrema lepadinum]
MARQLLISSILEPFILFVAVVTEDFDTMQSITLVSIYLLSLANAFPYGQQMLRHKRTPIDSDIEIPFPLPNATLPSPFASGSSGVPLPTATARSTGLFFSSGSLPLATAPTPSIPTITGSTLASSTRPVPTLANGTLPGTGANGMPTAPIGVLPMYTFVPTTTLSGTGTPFSLLHPPLPSSTTKPSRQSPACTIGSIECNSESEYSICVPGPGFSPLALNPGSLAGNHYKQIGRVPHSTTCVDGAIEGFTGDQCKIDGKIRCQGGEKGWSVCVGGFWTDMGDLPGKDVCFDGVIMNPARM